MRSNASCDVIFAAIGWPKSRGRAGRTGRAYHGTGCYFCIYAFPNAKIFSRGTSAHLFPRRSAAADIGTNRQEQRSRPNAGVGPSRDRTRAEDAQVQRCRPRVTADATRHSKVQCRRRSQREDRHLPDGRSHRYGIEPVFSEFRDEWAHLFYLSSAAGRLDRQRGRRSGAIRCQPWHRSDLPSN
jgi:hypothetical protein